MSWKDWFINDLQEQPQVTEERAVPNTQQPQEECDCSYADTLTFSQLFNSRYSSNTLSAVFACMEKIANTLASLPLRVVQQDAEGHQTILQHHPLHRIFCSRTISTSPMNITMKNAILDVMRRGNGYILIVRGADGQVTGLRYMDAAGVSIQYNQMKDSLYYLAPTYVKGKIMPENIIHLVKNTKADGITGVSVLTYARDVLDLSKAAEDAASEFFKSGCALNGVLTSTGVNLNAAQREQLKNSWSMKGSRTSIQVLPAGLNYQQIGVDSAKSQLLESRKYNLSEICRFFNVMPELIHASDKISTLESTNLLFLTQTLTTWITMIETEFTRKLFPDDETLSVDMDENELTLRCDKQTQAQYLSTLVTSGIISANEARAELGLKKIEGGDKITIAYSDINQNTINGNNDKKSDTDEEEKPDTEPKTKKRSKKIDK